LGPSGTLVRLRGSHDSIWGTKGPLNQGLGASGLRGPEPKCKSTNHQRKYCTYIVKILTLYTEAFKFLFYLFWPDDGLNRPKLVVISIYQPTNAHTISHKTLSKHFKTRRHLVRSSSGSFVPCYSYVTVFTIQLVFANEVLCQHIVLCRNVLWSSG